MCFVVKVFFVILAQFEAIDSMFISHYEHMPMQYTKICKVIKNEIFQKKNFDIFLTFAQNIDCGYKLEPVLKSTHNLCFGAKK